ncbi:GD14963 [Drosophila simulans]|uniref:GD14963 n=1 Tax=Drosophila simulans TaxID=7240 RepID=B4QK44_DROSI|nr:GD14963 [Drosophila simulans]
MAAATVVTGMECMAGRWHPYIIVVFLECDLQLVVGAVIWSVPGGTPLPPENEDPGLPCVRDYGLYVRVDR